METNGQSETELVKELCQPLYKSRQWLRFMSIAAIFAGLATTLGNLLIGFAKYGLLAVLGILAGLWAAWVGLSLWRSTSALVDAYQVGTKEALLLGLERLRTAIRLAGIALAFYIIAVPLIGMLVALLANRLHK